MKKISLLGNRKYIGTLFIVMQGIFITLLTIFILNQQYLASFQNYPDENQSLVIYIKNIPNENLSYVEDFLLQSVQKERLYIVRCDNTTDNEGYFTGFKIGVYGDAQREYASHNFLGDSILSTENLTELISSDSKESTLGVDIGSVHSIGNIPQFRFYEKVVIKKLPQLIEESKTINGTYHILGLTTYEQENNFISDLSEITGNSEESLQQKKGGFHFDSGLLSIFLWLMFGIQVFLNFVYFVITAVKSLNRQGKLTLLGWSRFAFAKEIFGSFIINAIICIPPLIILGYLFSGWPFFSPMIMSYFALAGVINLLLSGIELATASAIIFVTKPLDAIHGRLPKKILYVLGVFAYLFVNIGLLYPSYAVDTPLMMLSENNRLSRDWANISGYQMLHNISIGDDENTFTGQSKQLHQDLYNWYSSISAENGVYLINTQYYSQDILTLWANHQSYNSIPSKPFWLFVFSPNYLEELGIKISQDVLERAYNGVRLYLIPDNLHPDELENTKSWVVESRVDDISNGDIPTQFTLNPEFEFVTYDVGYEFFTWNVNSNDPSSADDPIIYVATPENMCYFENQSLFATGFNGYIKFADTETAEQYTTVAQWTKYNLADNQIIFSSVRVYIDGLQKGIWLSIAWFGAIFLFLILISSAILMTLAWVFRIANQEKINVKKFLGFNFWHLYKFPVICLISLSLFEILLMLVLRAKFGLLVVCINIIIQFFVFWKYMSKAELRQILLSFKGGE